MELSHRSLKAIETLKLSNSYPVSLSHNLIVSLPSLEREYLPSGEMSTDSTIPLPAQLVFACIRFIGIHFSTSHN
jgi:hypothetical protein